MRERRTTDFRHDPGRAGPTPARLVRGQTVAYSAGAGRRAPAGRSAARDRAAARVLAALALACGIVLVLAPPATASDASLKQAFLVWSKRIDADARAVDTTSLPRLRRSAERFRADALRAVRALRVQRSSSVLGTQARKQALMAFETYARAGQAWVLSARAGPNVEAAGEHARRARKLAERANRLLVAAARRLDRITAS